MTDPWTDFASRYEQTRWCPHEPTPAQRRFLDLTCREALYGGAAGGGKSDALLMGALCHVDTPGYAALLFRRTYTDLALPGAIMDRAHDWLGGTAAKWADRDKTWSFPSGATLTFGYMDGPRDHTRYQGSEVQFVGWDELTQFEERQYRYLFSRCRRKDGVSVVPIVRGATNPGGIGHAWVKERFVDRPDGRVFVPAKLEDNPYLDSAEYREALAQLDPLTRRQLADGEWVQDSGMLVYQMDPAKNLVDKLPLLPGGESWTYVLGADFGVTDPTALVVLAYTEHEDALYVVESDQWPGLAPSLAAETIRSWDERYRFERQVGDFGGLGKGYEAEFMRRGDVPMHEAQKHNKLGFIKLMNGDLTQGRLRIVRAGNEQLVEDLSSLAWKDETHQKEHPGMPNHLPDALLYGWRESRHYMSIDRPAQPKTQAEAQKTAAQARKERIIERNKRRLQEHEGDWKMSDEDWILGPDGTDTGGYF